MRITRFTFAAVTLALTVSLRAESPETRNWSLQDCIQQALEHNLEIRIERYGPEIGLFNVKGGYGAYDPTFSTSGQHDYNKSGSSVFPGSDFMLPGQESDTTTFRTGLGGNLPWGTRYDLTLNISDTDSLFYNDTNLLATARSSSSGSAKIGVTQPLLRDFWFNPTRLRITILKNRLKWSEQGFRGRVMNVAWRVERAYYDLMAGYENVKVRQSALELAQRLLAENKKRVEVGALAPLDEKQSESAVAARQADLIFAQSELARLENVLKKLLTDDFASWSSVNLEPSAKLQAERQVFDLQDSWSKGLTLRPELRQALLNLEQQGIQVKIDRNELYPQIDLNVGGGYSGSTPEFSGVLGDIERRDQPSWYVGGLFSYPLGNRTARYAHRASKAEQEARTLTVKKWEQDIMVEIDDAIKLARADFERVGATRKAREYAESALAAEQKKLESGKSTSFFVLQLQRDLTTARYDEIQALAEYNKALADLASVEGSVLERNRIDLEVK